MILDLQDTLTDTRNNLRAKQSCPCRNNCEFALQELKRSSEPTLYVFQTIEKYLMKKQCPHFWFRERQMDASWDALPTAE